MLELLRDPAWQVAGILIGSFVAVWIFRAQRTRRELSFGVLSARTLISVHNSLTSRVNVTLDGRSVQDVSLVVFALKNSGNVPIQPADFQRSIFFRFASSTSLLSVEVARRSPPNLEALLVVDGDVASLSPTLLNPGEHVVFQALIAGRDQSVNCDCRIEGISTLASLRRGAAPEKKSIQQRVGIAVISYPLIAALFGFLLSWSDEFFGTRFREILSINGSFALGVILILFVASVFEGVASVLKSRVLREGSRSIDDA